MPRVDFSGVVVLDYYPWDIMLQQGFHWMDKHGDAHWIPDMETSYLHNALRFARLASRGVSNEWWSFALILNGEMAQEEAMRTAEQYGDYDVPLIKGLINELARRNDEEPPHSHWELEGNSWTLYMEQSGMLHNAAIRSF